MVVRNKSKNLIGVKKESFGICLIGPHCHTTQVEHYIYREKCM